MTSYREQHPAFDAAKMPALPGGGEEEEAGEDEGWSSASEGEHEMWIRSAMHECKNKPLHVDPRYEIDEALRTYNPIHFKDSIEMKKADDEEREHGEEEGEGNDQHLEVELGNPFVDDCFEGDGESLSGIDDPFGMADKTTVESSTVSTPTSSLRKAKAAAHPVAPAVRKLTASSVVQANPVCSSAAVPVASPTQPLMKDRAMIKLRRRRSGSHSHKAHAEAGMGSPFKEVPALVMSSSPRRRSTSLARKKTKRFVPGFMRDTKAWSKRCCSSSSATSSSATSSSKPNRPRKAKRIAGSSNVRPSPSGGKRHRGRSIRELLDLADQRMGERTVKEKSSKTTVSSSVAGRSLFRRPKQSARRRRHPLVSQSINRSQIATAKSTASGWPSSVRARVSRKPAPSLVTVDGGIGVSPLFFGDTERDNAAKFRQKQRQRLQKRSGTLAAWAPSSPVPGRSQAAPSAILSPALRSSISNPVWKREREVDVRAAPIRKPPTRALNEHPASDVDLEEGCVLEGEQDVPLMASPDDEDDGLDPPADASNPLVAEIDQLRNALSSVSLMYEDQVSALRKKLGTTLVNSHRKEKKIALLKKKLVKSKHHRIPHHI